METTIKATIVADVDKKSFWDWIKFARDTWKEIDQKLKSRLELDVAQAQVKLKQIRQELKNTTDQQKTIKLTVDVNEVQRWLTESKRQLNNLVNTWDPALSRLQAKFNSVNETINGFKTWLTDVFSWNIVWWVTKIGSAFWNIWQILGTGAIVWWISAIWAWLVSATKSFADFEKELSNARAIFWLFWEEWKKAFKPLEELAIQLWATTKFTAKEAAEWISILWQAWFSTQETISTLPWVLDLASAANISIAQSADVAASVLRQYWIDASQTSRVLDVLTKTSIDSNVSISDLQESFKYFWPTAKALWVSIEESAAAIWVLWDNWIKWSVATRALGTAFANLANPTQKQTEALNQLWLSVFDAQWKFKWLGTLFWDIQTKTASFTQEQKVATLSTLFGNEAIQEAIVLTDNRNKLLERTNGLLNSQWVTQEIAKTQLDNLAWSYETLLWSIDSLAIKIWSFLAPAVKLLVDWLTILVNNAWIVTTALLTAVPAIFSFTGAITWAWTAIAFLTWPIWLVIAWLSALFVWWNSNVLWVQDLTRSLLWLWFSEDQIIAKSAELSKNLDDNNKKLIEVAQTTGDVNKMLVLMKESQDLLTQSIQDWTITNKDAESQYRNNVNQISLLEDALIKWTITQEAFNLVTQEINKSQADLETVLGAVWIATLNNTDANEAYNKAKLDTWVSQKALEDLRIKAIETTKAVLTALKLQLKGQQDFAKSQKQLASVVPLSDFSWVSQWNWAIDETTKQIQELEASLESLESQNTKAIASSRASWWDVKWKTTSWWKSEAEKAKESAIKKEKKDLEDLKDQKKKFAEEEKKLLLDLANAYKANSIAIYDSTVADLKKVEDKIKSLDDQIKNLKQSIIDLEKWEDVSLAQRVVEINKQLQDQNLSVNDRIALEKELALATQNTTAEEIARQTAISQENPTERIIRETAEKKAQLEQQLKDAQVARAIEKDEAKRLTDLKIALENDYTAKYKSNIAERETAEMANINRISAALDELYAKEARLWQSWWGNTTNTTNSTNNNQKNINVTFDINSSVDLNTAVKKVSGF